MHSSTTDWPQADIHLPPEWAPQKAIWTAWPAAAEEWNGDLDTPRRDVAALVHALAPDNRVHLLVDGLEARQSAERAVGDVADIVPAAYGDIWLRDTGPLFATMRGEPRALRFHTNGWGGKFSLPGDESVGDDIARLAGVATQAFDFVLEGGAIDHDGAGTILTTRQTLLNPNRNGWSQADAEAVLQAALGARKILWIDEGLTGDHTDGHVDNIARFAGPGRIVIQEPAGPDDPNAAVFAAIARNLDGATDADGRIIEVVSIPSPGRVPNALGEISPASHLNFAIANGIVVVPVFGTNTQAEALGRLQAVFPDRKVVGLPAAGLLGAGDAGGGAFHCITREEPDFTRGRLTTQ
ncbi:agmatine deiminase family protein [Methyloceanibacter caenitepidi]|uniref:Agmatine deiminase n=1 Tax=Methyloceanibacter caenitepidi TaxID=1384459 RepID=A0A0A8K6P5_9HYPH|nr:agmatine deiminase family protein [Methyloceanibacter caenitepidi]BAQ18202.1 agmatine deiminase [Methyloceanibacter caenitepidi]